MYKIKIKSPSQEGQILIFTCKEYEIKNNTISFIDKKGSPQVWNINSFINAEKVDE